MEKILEKWTERHCTDSDNLVGNDHYIEHEICITPEGDLVHRKNTYKWDSYDCDYYLADCEGIILKRGLK